MSAPTAIAKMADPAAPAQASSLAARHAGVAFGRLLLFLLACLGWWGAVELGLASRFFVSDPVSIGRFLWENFSKEVWPHMLETLLATLLAFAMSAVFGIGFGLLLTETPVLKRLLDPFLTALNSLPRIALAPIFILWFGIGLASKIALAVSLGFFIVLAATVAGIKNIDPTLIRLSRSLGCSPWQQFRKVTLPWAVPSVFAGLKLALVYSFLGVVTSEMIASRVGLGQLIMYYSGVLRMDAVLGILTVLACCSVILTVVADAVESALLGSWVEPTGSAAL